MWSLDDFAEQHRLGSVDLIKLDTEATEHLVLDGARESLERYRPVIICEVLPGKVEKEIHQRIETLNYDAFVIRESGLENVQSLSHSSDSSNDYLFCPPEKTELLQALLKD